MNSIGDTRTMCWLTALPAYIFELTTTSDVTDSAVVLDILSRTNRLLPIDECFFIADMGYDFNKIYDAVKNTYHGEALSP